MRRNLGNPDAEKVLQDRSIAFSVTGYKPGARVDRRVAAGVMALVSNGSSGHPFQSSISPPGSKRVARALPVWPLWFAASCCCACPCSWGAVAA